MPQPLDRRGLLRRLWAVLLGAGAAHAATAADAPATRPTGRGAEDDSNAVVYKASGLPPGLSINVGPGVLRGQFRRHR